jgi:putative membrane protein
MKRILFSTACCGLLSLGACNAPNNDATGNAADTKAPDVTATPTPADNGTGMNNPGATDTAMAANGPTAPHATDAEFMQSAAHSDQNEIQLSKLALEKGVTGMAKQHANQMITDHTKSTAELKPVAQKKSVTLPSDMDAEHKAIAEQMRSLSGKELETKFMQQMLLDHQKTVNTMVAHQRMTQDADLQGFITKTIPVVQAHLDMFKQHNGSM